MVAKETDPGSVMAIRTAAFSAAVPHERILIRGSVGLPSARSSPMFLPVVSALPT